MAFKYTGMMIVACRSHLGIRLPKEFKFLQSQVSRVSSEVINLSVAVLTFMLGPISGERILCQFKFNKFVDASMLNVVLSNASHLSCLPKK
jgi:hypothetical protein